MEWLNLLFAILITITLIHFIIPNRDVIAPNFIFSVSVTVCVGFALYCSNSWGFVLKEKSFNVYMFGIVSFLIATFFMKLWITQFRKNLNIDVSNIMPSNSIRISDVTLNVLILLSILGIVLSILLIQRYGGNSAYRDARVYGQVEGDFIISQLSKILLTLTYVLTYIVIYNKIYVNVHIKRQWKYILFFIITLIFYTLFSGGRQPIIEYILYTFFILITCMREKKGGKKEVTKVYWKILIISILTIPLFYYSSQLVGRNFDRIKQYSIFEYIGIYLGGGLYAFDLNIDSPCSTLYWGQSSFAYIYSKLISFGILPDYIEDMTFHKFELYGTTVTIFGRWYEDWGTTGVVIMSAIVGILFSWLYYGFVKYPKRNTKNHLAKILYVKLVMALVWAGYDDRITATLSLNTIIILILMIIEYYFIFKKRIRLKC